MPTSKLITLAITNADGQVGDAELTAPEALALAQFVKRIGWSEFSSHAIDDSEAYLIKDAVEKLQDAMARAGYAPR